MSPDELSPSPVKQPNVASACEIKDLSDSDLTEIFKHLPPLSRLLAAEVCKRWHGISKLAWLDITLLDLTSIPGPNIAAIVKLCPNLRSVSAVRKTFALKELHIFSSITLSSLKLYRCTVADIPVTTASNLSDPLSAIFSSNLRNADWTELVLHELTLQFQIPAEVHGQRDSAVAFHASFPATLKRLQLSGLKWSPSGYSSGLCYDSSSFLRDIGQLGHLNYLMLHSTPSDMLVWTVFCYNSECLESLQGLRELYFGMFGGSFSLSYHASFLLKFPLLETLFLNSCRVKADDDFVWLVTKHPALRILVLTGNISTSEIEFPARVLYANGFNSAPLPQLHIFVGKEASERILFPKFQSDAAKVYPITEPLPLFLERDDIKPIFEGVWIAAKIKEAAKEGEVLYDYARDVTSSVRSMN